MKKRLLGLVAVAGTIAFIIKKGRKHPADEHFEREAAPRQIQVG